MSYLCFDFVIPACPVASGDSLRRESFWKKDTGLRREIPSGPSLRVEDSRTTSQDDRESEGLPIRLRRRSDGEREGLKKDTYNAGVNN
jgi:hypothetical protein